MSEQKATNVHWHDGEINRPDRAQLLGHGGATLWFTGLSGSGKSTIRRRTGASTLSARRSSLPP